MTTYIDDSTGLRIPTPVGPERTSFPFSEDMNVQIISQDFVQKATFYQAPTGSLINVGVYNPSGSYLDQSSFQSLSGGVVKFTYRFIKNHTQYNQQKEVFETVAFPGWKQRRVNYAEDLDLYYENGRYVHYVTSTYNGVGREINMRKPFSQTVRCVETKTIVSASTQGTFSKPRFQPNRNVYINGQYYRVSADGNTVSRGGTTLSVNDPSLLRGSQPEIFYEKGTENLTREMEAFKEQNRTTTEIFKSRMPQRYTLPEQLRSLFLPTRVISKNIRFQLPPASQQKPVTNILSETSTPTVSAYQSRVGQNTMVVKPTEFEEIGGSFMFKTETLTTWL